MTHKDSYTAIRAFVVRMRESAEQGELYGLADDCKRLLAMLDQSSGPRDIAKELIQGVEETVEYVKGSRGGPVVIPDGWKLVPLKPTKEMIAVGDSIRASVDGGPPRGIHYPPAVGPEDVYEFMVEAAPSPSATGDGS